MPVHQPAAINSAFAAAYNARNVDELISLYQVDAIVVNMDGSRSVGTDEIHHHLAELVQLGGSMTSTNVYAIEHGDIALVGAHWSVSFDDGREPVSGRSAEVLRRQSDSTWKYIIDNPDSPST